MKIRINRIKMQKLLLSVRKKKTEFQQQKFPFADFYSFHLLSRVGVDIQMKHSCERMIKFVLYLLFTIINLSLAIQQKKEKKRKKNKFARLVNFNFHAKTQQ